MRPPVLALLLLLALGAVALLVLSSLPPTAEVPAVERGRPDRAPVAARTADTPAAPAADLRTAAAPDTGQTRRGPPPVEGPLTGRVLDEQGRAIADATVAIESLPLRAQRGDATALGIALGRTTTDADGRFAVDGLERGWLRVTAAAEGHATVARVASGRGSYVELVLPPAGGLEVRVVRMDGAPQPAVSVRVGARRAIHETTTDEQGVAVFSSLPPGAVYVVAASQGGAAGGTYPDALIRPGTTTRIELAIETYPRVGGRVLDVGTELPIVGAEVHVARPGHAEVAGPTDSEGRFGPVPAAAPGARAHVAVRAPGYQPALVPVELGAAGEDLEVDVHLELFEDWRGVVVDGNGQGVAGARVGWTDDGIAGRVPDATTTDEKGAFRLPLPPLPRPGDGSRSSPRPARGARPMLWRRASLALIRSGWSSKAGRRSTLASWTPRARPSPALPYA